MDASEYEGKHEDERLSFMNELPEVVTKGGFELVQWKGFWELPSILKAIVAMEAKYEPLSSDIILASFPKTGTTWLKALTTTILNFHKSKHTCAPQSVDDPLLTRNPHQLIPFLEGCFLEDSKFDIDKMTSSPRVFSTHIPYSLLPENVKNSSSKIVYITRNPMDTFVSHWGFFYQKSDIPNVPIEDAFATFCQGVIPYGPYFDHVLENWKACNEKPEGMLFLTYEELKQEPHKHVKRLAEFLGCLLNPNDIEQVVWRCSYDRLSNLDVNKDPSNVLQWSGHEFSANAFFRRGIVGDSTNYLTPDMVEKLRELATQKWEGSGLKFKSVDEILAFSN